MKATAMVWSVSLLILLAVLLSLSRVALGSLLPTPARGWDDEYSVQAILYVNQHPELMSLSSKAMANVCPKWSKLNRAQRGMFYVELLKAISKAESGHHRFATCIEKALGKDATTGYPVASEGLFQLSYQDAKWTKDCPFDWKQDRDLFKKDWAAQDKNKTSENRLLKCWRSEQPRTVLDPYINLKCATSIMATRARNVGANTFDYSMGRYWSVMRQERAPFQSILKALKANTKCF